jgi:hypothetical protein
VISNSANPSGPAPTVVAVGDQVNGVAPNRIQEVQFSEAMDPSTINAQSFQVTDSSGKTMPGNVSYDPDFNTASYQPNPPLQANSHYTATITTAAASTGEMHLATPYTYTFDTRSTTDTSPISVNSVSPTANATCVSVTAPIIITFDEAPDASTLTAANLVVNGPSGSISVKISTNVTTTQVVLTPASALPSGTITVTVSNVADLASVKMAAPYTWSFSTACGSGSNVAYVYLTSVASATAPATFQIVGYAADSNGQLTPLPGSPFNQNVGSTAATSSYLLASSNTGSDINTYTIGPNGALTLGPQFDTSQIESQIAAQIAAQHQTGSQTGVTCGMGVDTFDRIGQSLYTEVLCSDGSNKYDLIASFAFDSANGTLRYLGDAGTGVTFNFPALPVLGNDEYAYQNGNNGCGLSVGGYYSFSRSSSGLLTLVSSTSPAVPPTPAGATEGAGPFGYVAGPLATDNTNHAAIAMVPCFFLNGANPPMQLAAYTAAPDGSLTTTDTYATMPSTSINPNVMAMSPSGNLVAVGGNGGVQIFHFNGSSSITSFSGVLTTDFINWMAWDNSNHLYALQYPNIFGNTSPTGNLHVFTVTDSGATEAPGSPYTIPYPLYLTVSSQR